MEMKFIRDLFTAPDGARADEISLLALGFGLLGGTLIIEFAVLQAFSVIVLRQPFPCAAFADGAATLLGGVAGGVSAIATAMGLKAKFGG